MKQIKLPDHAKRKIMLFFAKYSIPRQVEQKRKEDTHGLR